MRHRRLLHTIAAVYAAVVVLAILGTTLSPVPIDATFAPLVQVVLAICAHIAPLSWITYPWLESLSNVSMFMPLGILIGLLLRPQIWWLALAVSAASSLMLEFLQATFLPGRFASMEDVLENSIGGVLGFLIASGVVALVREVHRMQGEIAAERAALAPAAVTDRP